MVSKMEADRASQKAKRQEDARKAAEAQERSERRNASKAMPVMEEFDVPVKSQFGYDKQMRPVELVEVSQRAVTTPNPW